MQTASDTQLAKQSSQTLNPVFKAKHAERAELEVDSSSWQLQGLAADARSTPDDVPNVAWNRSTSSGSNLFVAVEGQLQSQHSAGVSDNYYRRHRSSSGSQDGACSITQLSDDQPGSADWMSSSSSSDDTLLAPLRSMSLPEAAVAGLLQREPGAMPAPRRDASLPAGFRTSLPAVPAMLQRQATPVLTLRQRYGSRQISSQPQEEDNLARSSLSLSDESDSADSEVQAVLEDIQLQMPGTEEDERAVVQQVKLDKPASWLSTAPASQQQTLFGSYKLQCITLWLALSISVLHAFHVQIASTPHALVCHRGSAMP